MFRNRSFKIVLRARQITRTILGPDVEDEVYLQNFSPFKAKHIHLIYERLKIKDSSYKLFSFQGRHVDMLILSRAVEGEDSSYNVVLFSR